MPVPTKAEVQEMFDEGVVRGQFERLESGAYAVVPRERQSPMAAVYADYIGADDDGSMRAFSTALLLLPEDRREEVWIAAWDAIWDIALDAHEGDDESA